MITSLSVSTRAEVFLEAKRWQICPYIVLKSNRKSGTGSSFMRFPPYFYFRIGRTRQSGVVQHHFCNLLHQIWRLQTVMVAFNGKRRSLTLFPVLPKPEVVFNGQTVADRSVDFSSLASFSRIVKHVAFCNYLRWYQSYLCYFLSYLPPHNCNIMYYIRRQSRH